MDFFPSNSCSELEDFSHTSTAPQQDLTSGLLKYTPCPNSYIFVFNKLYLIFFPAIKLKTVLKILRDFCFIRGDMFVWLLSKWFYFK